jgi:hypothetical protein
MNSHILRVLLLSPVFSLLTMAQSLEGVWQGNVTMPNAPESRAAIRVTRTDGSLAGVMFLLDAGLYCRVLRPMPARWSAFAQSTLQLWQVQTRLYAAVFSSWPSTCPISTVRVAPHRAQMGSPGGGQAFAR